VDRKRILIGTLIAVSPLVDGCTRTDSSTGTPASRLVDLFEPRFVSGAPATPARAIPRTEWRFDSGPSTAISTALGG